MSDEKRKCPRCGGETEAGFILDTGEGSRVQSHWCEGDPVTSRLTGNTTLKGKAVRKVVTYRCTKCGFLESYATEVIA